MTAKTTIQNDIKNSEDKIRQRMNRFSIDLTASQIAEITRLTPYYVQPTSYWIKSKNCFSLASGSGANFETCKHFIFGY